MTNIVLTKTPLEKKKIPKSANYWILIKVLVFKTIKDAIPFSRHFPLKLQRRVLILFNHFVSLPLLMKV